MREFTFTAASTNIANYQDLGDLGLGADGPSQAAQGPQSGRVTAQGNGASGSAVIRFVLTDGAYVYFTKDVTATVGAVRTNFAGDGGSYICTLDEEFVDFAGGGAVQTVKDLGWRVGCSTLTTITSLKVQIHPSRVT